MRGTRYILLALTLVVRPAGLLAQADSSTAVLDSITIQAYQGKKLLQTPAAINYIPAQQLERFSNSNVLQALNATPGVRMEERSPGSYRLNIRGSAVRSPFGVRNVKIYYGDIPFTAPGGSSMLNMLGFYNIGSVEVIKGPAGSMYGAGTGGVLLLQPLPFTSQKLNAGIIGGSYGLFGANTAVSFKNNTIRYERLQGDGYREHTAMRRNNFSWTGQLHSTVKNNLKAHVIYSDLFYETPGALTANEYNANPRAARPATPAFPGAKQAKASIDQQSLLLGISHTVHLGKLTNTTGIYGAVNSTANPTVQNYEKKKEPHFGGRTILEHHFNAGSSLIEWSAGMEFQKGNFHYNTYKNVAGKPDSLRIEDKLEVQQFTAFAQAAWHYQNWMISAGASINRLQFDFRRRSTTATIHEQKQFSGEFVPRFAVLYKISKTVAAYVNIANGFSPPAADEIFADNNSYNLALAAEKGWNYEPGIRGSIWQNRFYFDLSYFSTGLSNSIVTRRDAGGGNYYVNAGKTAQQGFELALQYRLCNNASGYWFGSAVKTTYSHYRFWYKKFEQAGNDYSGNAMPGVSPDNVNLLLDITTKPGYYLNLTYTYTGKIWLNDANSAAAGAYHLLAAKAGYRFRSKKTTIHLFAGADNITNTRYSSGNDINGFGGRYFNVAPGRTLYAGAGIGL